MSDTTFMSSISDTTNNSELIYDTETVSNILGVQSSTIRKYCALMQKHGYEFNKNSVGHRIFYSKDVEVIKQIVDLKNSGSMTLTEAVQTILNSDIEDITDVTDMAVVVDPSYEKLLEQFKNFKDEQMEFNKKLLEQIKKQEDYIKNSILERDRRLIAALRESMETRNQLIDIATELKNKKPWWQFWK